MTNILLAILTIQRRRIYMRPSPNLGTSSVSTLLRIAIRQPRGFAFVEMTDAQEAQNAISQLNGAELHGRAMSVNEARPKPTGNSGRGGFGGPRRAAVAAGGNRPELPLAANGETSELTN